MFWNQEVNVSQMNGVITLLVPLQILLVTVDESAAEFNGESLTVFITKGWGLDLIHFLNIRDLNVKII